MDRGEQVCRDLEAWSLIVVCFQHITDESDHVVEDLEPHIGLRASRSVSMPEQHRVDTGASQREIDVGVSLSMKALMGV